MSNEDNKSKFIDINDLGLEEEPLGGDFDPNANSFSGPPPLDKGKYVVLPAFAEADPSKRVIERQYKTDKGHAPGRYLSTRLIMTVVSPEGKAGRKFFDDFVSTGIWMDDTSKVASILHLLGFKDAVSEAKSHEDLMRALGNALSGNPVIGVTLDWEGRVKNDDGGYDTIYKTQTEFPVRKDGTYDPVITDGEGNVLGNARTNVKGYFKASGQAAASA